MGREESDKNLRKGELGETQRQKFFLLIFSKPVTVFAVLDQLIIFFYSSSSKIRMVLALSAVSAVQIFFHGHFLTLAW